jgi:2-oxoisovalerate dehydrogenase E1 component
MNLDSAELYRSLYRIRCFEQTVLDNFPRGIFFGTTHTYLGQEADAVGILSNLQPQDIVFSNHRCHGHFIAYGGDLRALFAELMGKASGVCGGRGGSQHLQWRNFYSNGVQGGILPVATGMALAEKFKGSQAATVVFLGDGTLGEGVVYEALNMASLWDAPILFVLENNHIAQTTPVEASLAGDIAARFSAFGIPVRQLDSSDVLAIQPPAGELLGQVRSAGGPQALVLHTWRFGPHSKGDDTRPTEEVTRLRSERDPLAIQATRLEPHERAEIERQVESEVASAFQAALEDPLPNPQDLSYAGGIEHPAERGGQRAPVHASVLERLNQALHESMASDPRVYLLGEDVLDPYSGAFKVTRGLSTTYADRVLTTPISEAGITGVGSGMALRGLRPVVELMFGDFIALAADQLINHAAKFRWMYNQQVRVPLVVRLPMGGRRGYGPTHSQTLEKHFLGVPGLRVLAPTNLGDPGALLREAILKDDDPVLFVENKLLYLLPIHTADDLADFEVEEIQNEASGAAAGIPAAIPDLAGYAPSFRLRVQDAPPPTLTLAAYGYMADLARQAALRLAYEQEVFAELVVLTQLAPFEVQPIIESAQTSQRLLVIEEGGLSLGWGSEVLARAWEAMGPGLLSARRLAAMDLPIPASGPLEQAVLPGIEAILQAALETLKTPSGAHIFQGTQP